MNNQSNPNELLLEILMTEIETVILNSEKIQSRFKQISNMGILKSIAHQNFGANLGDLAEAILKGVENKDSFPQLQQGQNSSETNSTSESRESLQQSSSEEGASCQGNPCQNENIHEEIESENNCPLQQVDGKKLSPQEIRFQEYLEKNFNEDLWLEKAKIDYHDQSS
jgi:hypothetical protein